MEQLPDAQVFTPRTQLVQNMLADIEYFKELPETFVVAPVTRYNDRTRAHEPFTAVKMVCLQDELDGSRSHLYKGYVTDTVIAERIAPIIRNTWDRWDGTPSYHDTKASSHRWFEKHLGKEIVGFASDGPSHTMQSYELRNAGTQQPRIINHFRGDKDKREYDTFSMTRLIRNYVEAATNQNERAELAYAYYATDLYDTVLAYAYTNDGFKTESESMRTAINDTFADALLPIPPVGYYNNELVFNTDALRGDMQLGVSDEMLEFLSNNPRANILYSRLRGTPFGMLGAIPDILSSQSILGRRAVADKVITQAVAQINWQHEKGILDYERLISPSVLAVHPVISAMLYEFVAAQPDIPTFCRENKVVPLQFVQEYVTTILRRYREDSSRFGTNVNAIYMALTKHEQSKSIAFQDIIQLAARSQKRQTSFSSIEDVSKVSDALHVLFELTRDTDPETMVAQAAEDRLHTDLIDLMLGVGIGEKQAMNNLTIEDIKTRYPRKSVAELKLILEQLQSGKTHASVNRSQPEYISNKLFKQFRARLFMAGRGVIS